MGWFTKQIQLDSIIDAYYGLCSASFFLSIFLAPRLPFSPSETISPYVASRLRGSPFFEVAAALTKNSISVHREIKILALTKKVLEVLREEVDGVAFFPGPVRRQRPRVV